MWHCYVSSLVLKNALEAFLQTPPTDLRAHAIFIHCRAWVWRLHRENTVFPAPALEQDRFFQFCTYIYLWGRRMCWQNGIKTLFPIGGFPWKLSPLASWVVVHKGRGCFCSHFSFSCWFPLPFFFGAWGEHGERDETQNYILMRLLHLFHAFLSFSALVVLVVFLCSVLSFSMFSSLCFCCLFFFLAAFLFKVSLWLCVWGVCAFSSWLTFWCWLSHIYIHTYIHTHALVCFFFVIFVCWGWRRFGRGYQQHVLAEGHVQSGVESLFLFLANLVHSNLLHSILHGTITNCWIRS